MADSLERLRRDLCELREDMLEVVSSGAAPGAEVGVSLAAFARLVGFEPITIAKDLRSKDPARRRRWPIFYRPVDGRGDEHTTAEDIRRWRQERCRSTHVVPQALATRLARGGRA